MKKLSADNSVKKLSDVTVNTCLDKAFIYPHPRFFFKSRLGIPPKSWGCSSLGSSRFGGGPEAFGSFFFTVLFLAMTFSIS